MSRLRLIREIFEHVYQATDTFSEEDIGLDLAYLLGAIAQDTGTELEENNALWKILEPLGKQHPVWRYITRAP